MKKTQITMNKPVYLGFKIVLYEFWYDYIKPKHGKNTELCCMVTDSFIVRVKTDNI